MCAGARSYVDRRHAYTEQNATNKATNMIQAMTFSVARMYRRLLSSGTANNLLGGASPGI